MDKITPAQLKYLNILLSKAFGPNRKMYLKIFWQVQSSKDLTKAQASTIIERFIETNQWRERNISEAMDKILEALGQQRLV